MGADLIGYFGKGPKKLPQRAVPAAIAEAERRLEWLQRARPIVESREHAAVIDLLRDCPWLDPKQLPCTAADVDSKQLYFEIEHLLDTVGDVTDLTGEQVVKAFIEFWPPHFRDTAHVVDPDCPDKLIVFAGEHSWGDTPTGAGFQLLNQAGILGFAAVLGVWIEAAFFSLRIPCLPKGESHESTE
ncbi:MAG: hypothetical protein IT445_12145 [Phycisphaeraceae bacterium]|nr:hypothetical protein [Phycisphaeraceae bacterium]